MIFNLTRLETTVIQWSLVFLWETFDHLQQLVKGVHIQAFLEALVHRQRSVLGVDWVVQVQSETADTQANRKKVFQPFLFPQTELSTY